MTQISAEAIAIAYDKKSIIDGLSLHIPQSQITTIIGANGCGKSTLLKGLTRLLPVSKGAVYLDGQSIATLATKEVAKKIALLPQVQEATDGTTVYELISYGRFPHQSYLGKLSQADKETIHWAMEATKVTAYANQPVDALSGGQRQRVWIAMALAQDTDTIFLDEPTTYLDMNHQLEILELLKTLNQESGKTMVMVLHDLNLSARYSDHLIAMKKGQIKYSGTVRDIMTPAIIQDIFQIKAQLIDDPIHNRPILLTYQLQ
ncbi:UNVERIFIED_CONTAM: ABC transporter ATP-binding protein [Streptococcus canis]|uniref:Ferrichrome transport ATP-binding protein n=1 Tax=Streptococcus canis FSL Z3-227 TaxID=482234 RepID=A0AAV3FS58_STRCB|nr:ABC transporter ATP-binding protein [Streptococcus canis]EIQ81242.1 ferrichrome transport ATP-binding protein [Streptococcus canis FSL Z3-227]MDV5987722.1 ABC transporter ATP-binding protein [Streptococcus canis]MDV5993604.1 ABC transporter ATP-binding protein [Streptococcus canis]MDV6001343.1 ABC transporter ATP-binding protein [Streptococcus canis]MDV6022652.1 ABC transporter ATP-binding protein [Streptococcus canis]